VLHLRLLPWCQLHNSYLSIQSMLHRLIKCHTYTRHNLPYCLMHPVKSLISLLDIQSVCIQLNLHPGIMCLLNRFHSRRSHVKLLIWWHGIHLGKLKGYTWCHHLRNSCRLRKHCTRQWGVWRQTYLKFYHSSSPSLGKQ